MFCCNLCFGDTHLKEAIKCYSKQIGTCTFCESDDVALIDPSDLADKFAPIEEFYEKSNEDKNTFRLIELLREDWSLFENLENKDAELLLGIILNSKDIKNTRYLKRVLDEDKITQWDELGKELKDSNRFFPVTFEKLKKDGLGGLISDLQIKLADLGDEIKFYRSRKNDGLAIQPIDKMKGPPSGRATAGRVNPFGISCLYVASTLKTAIAELRPHKSEQLTVAELVTSKERKIVLIDLRNPRKVFSPFKNAEMLERRFADLGLLVRLSQDLSKPIFQHEAEIEYLPTQFLCEYIKSIGFDGVIYNSALGDGHNYVFFDQTILETANVNVFEVDAIDVSYSTVER